MPMNTMFNNNIDADTRSIRPRSRVREPRGRSPLLSLLLSSLVVVVVVVEVVEVVVVLSL